MERHINFFFKIVFKEPLFTLATSSWIQASCQFCALILFFVDSIFYALSYRYYVRNGSAGHPSYVGIKAYICDVDFYGELFNVLASIGYLGTGLYQLCALLNLNSYTTTTSVRKRNLNGCCRFHVLLIFLNFSFFLSMVSL